MFKFKIASSSKSFPISINSSLPISDLFNQIGEKVPSPFQISFGYPRQVITNRAHGKILIQDLLDDSSLLKIEEIQTNRKFSRKIIPADNNYLFNAINTCMHSSQDLRASVCSTIKSNPKKYDSILLEGKTPNEYCSWISNPQSWGGEIELEALSSALQICIKVVIVQIPTIKTYNSSNETGKCIFLLYDGIHFDYISENPNNLTIFSIEDEEAEAESLRIAAQLKEERQFTDTSNFSLKCMICNCGLKGQKEALEHGKETGHMNFCEF